MAVQPHRTAFPTLQPVNRMAEDRYPSDKGPDPAALMPSGGCQSKKTDAEPVTETATMDAQRRIAVLAPSNPDRDFIAGSLRAIDHHIVEFSSLKDLAQALFAEARFDLLLVSFDGDPETMLSDAKSIRRLIGTAAALVLLVRPEQLLANRWVVSGALNEFLVMPCEDVELVARVDRALALIPKTQALFAFGRYVFDPARYTITAGDQCARLQPRQFQLALYLFQHANRTHSREEISMAVWRKIYARDQSRTIDVHINHLRKMLARMSASDALLISVRGFGYLLHLDTHQNGQAGVRAAQLRGQGTPYFRHASAGGDMC
ncbi:winged-helix domain-containing protein [Variovorax sp.]|jgi:DNA-binding response OmpR family regulator|uniref:winged-helix domain-containing protein n=1 Tax=Variovorax sp. TaxID=1871043 RepID=UPI0037DA638E